MFCESRSTCGCSFDVFMGGGELHVLLLGHLDHSPVKFFFGCAGSSLQHMGASLLLWRAGSRACRLSSCSMLASLVVVLGLSCPMASGILAPRPRIEPESPALEGGFSTTGPQGKSHKIYFFRAVLDLLRN